MNNALQIPEMPQGKTFAKDSFWWQYRKRFVFARPKDKDHRWLDSQRKYYTLRGLVFPPKPIFVKTPAPMPQPWDGRDEKPGRVPRTSK